MASQKVEVTGGIGFFQLLTVVFIVLKLTGYISWSWTWVLSPLWIPLSFALAAFVVLCVVAILVGGLGDNKTIKLRRRN